MVLARETNIAKRKDLKDIKFASWDEDFLSDDSSFGENEGDSSENEQELNYEKMGS